MSNADGVGSGSSYDVGNGTNLENNHVLCSDNKGGRNEFVTQYSSNDLFQKVHPPPDDALLDDEGIASSDYA